MNRGHWSFPKGHMKLNENEKLTALREIKEETNLDVDLIEGYRETVKYLSDPETEKEVVYFLAQPKSGIIQKQEAEIKKIAWFKFENAIHRLTFNTDKEILKNAQLRMSELVNRPH